MYNLWLVLATVKKISLVYVRIQVRKMCTILEVSMQKSNLYNYV